jgi:hypothetical protein
MDLEGGLRSEGGWLGYGWRCMSAPLAWWNSIKGGKQGQVEFNGELYRGTFNPWLVAGGSQLAARSFCFCFRPFSVDCKPIWLLIPFEQKGPDYLLWGPLRSSFASSSRK